jgi:hypothetical protein
MKGNSAQPSLGRLAAKLGQAVVNALPACERVTRLASHALDRKLTLREKLEIRVHLPMCQLCSRYARQLAVLHDTAPETLERTPAPAERLTADERERLKRALRES